MLLVCATALCAPHAIADVVINEIMYHPASDQNGDEFVELYNTGGSSVDLTGYCFDGISYCFTGGLTSIGPGQYIVLASDAAQFLTTYSVTADDVYTLQLSDNDERLALMDGLVVIDEVAYQDDGQWPVTADGMGPSIEVVDPTQDNSTPRNWRASNGGATPGAINSVDAVGLPPWVDNPTHPQDLMPSTGMVVTATVLDASSVDLIYKIDFGGEMTIPMLDDGASNDGGAGDLVYGATIPGQPADTLIRYRIAVSGATGTMRYPRIDDTVTYDGTVVVDPTLSSALPIFHWYMDPADYANALAHKLTDDLEPAVLFYDNKLYDAVQVRVRGQSSRTWPKPPWKFFFPQGHNFSAPNLILRDVDTFNMQANYSDKAYVREILSWETVRDAGVPYNQVFPIRVEQNGTFFGLFNFLEASDADWVTRNKLSPTASRYRAFDDFRDRVDPMDTADVYEKEFPLDEDYTELWSFLLDLNNTSGTQLTNLLRDEVDIPGMINYIAVMTIIHNNDHMKKNYFAYQSDVTGRWVFYPWDLDLTFGRNFTGSSGLTDELWADVDTVPGQAADVSPSHPLFGSGSYRKVNRVYNRMIDRLMGQDDIRTMYFRRLRTLMDTLLGGEHYEDRIDELVPLIAPEAALDASAWGQYPAPQTLTQATDLLKSDYLNVRRIHLFVTHSLCDIPGPQSAQPRIVINELMYNPSSGIEDEFVELYNPSTTESVDISGWRLDGVALTVPAGTVVLPDSYVLFVRNDIQFRAQYGGGRFIGAQYKGSLADSGEPLVLTDANGAEISSVLYDIAAPWPTAANGGGPSLELIDSSQSTSKVVNWTASVGAGGTPGAANSTAGVINPVPELFINEVLPDNASINSDEMSEFDPWIEIYNASSSTIDLDGMFLSDDLGTPTEWAFPSGPESELCGGCWLLVWADGETGEGPLHSNFSLSVLGGVVGLFASDTTLIDYVAYDPVASDHAVGRFPDASSDTRVLTIPTPSASNDAPQSPLILNEYNAVSSANNLDNNNSDTYWGRIPGNGGDWFELAVTTDHLDVRGWKLDFTDDVGGAGESSHLLTFTSDGPPAPVRGFTSRPSTSKSPTTTGN
jgi:spore coat protein CotH